MPRPLRTIRPGALIHIIVRFLNGEFILDSALERGEYLRRAGEVFRNSDWSPLAYGLMSTHTHLASIAGDAPFADISQPLHSGFAGWLNPRRRRRGPVLAGRPSTYAVDPAGAGRLIAYLHNNPVRAGLAGAARDSSWTSHRAYMGTVLRPDWLCVDAGLQLCGYERSRAGLASFEEFVDLSASSESERFEDPNPNRTRTEVRRRLGSAAELGYAEIGPSGSPRSCEILTRPRAVLRDDWQGDLAVTINRLAEAEGVSLESLQSKSRLRIITRVRKLAVLCAHTYLGVPLVAIAGLLGISPEAARQLEKSAGEDQHAAAHRLATSFRGENLKT